MPPSPNEFIVLLTVVFIALGCFVLCIGAGAGVLKLKSGSTTTSSSSSTMSPKSLPPSKSIFSALSFLLTTVTFFSFFFFLAKFSSLAENILLKSLMLATAASAFLSSFTGAGASKSFFFLTITRPRLF